MGGGCKIQIMIYSNRRLDVDEILNMLGETKESLPNFSYILSSEFYTYLFKSMYSYSREYHTLEHINYLFGVLSSLIKEKGVKIKLLDEFCIAILFHDIYQYTSNSFNSDIEFSSRLAFSLLNSDNRIKENLNLFYIHQLIMATDYSNDMNSKEEFTEDQKLFRDLDLSVLSLGKKNYKRYAAQLRSEVVYYSSTGIDINVHAYKKERINFLQDMLNSDSKIYLSEYFDNEGEKEEAARRNMNREIKALQQGIGEF